jgi:tripartite-type tricarboxylate transporter receptor subunit TctC
MVIYTNQKTAFVKPLIVTGAVFATGGQERGPASYPTRPVQIIVPWAPGGGADNLVRTIARYIDLGGQPTVVVNIEGASGFVGTMETLGRAPDGYTILMQDIPNVLAYTLSGQTDRRVFEELVPICVLGGDYHIVTTNAQSGIRTMEALVAHIKANPGTIRWGTIGARSANRVNTMWIAEDLGILDLVTLVPYDSAGAHGRPALLGDHIQVLTCGIGDVRANIESGDIVPLLVISDQRIGVLPNTPTTLESGANATHFIARTFWAPRGTPTHIISFLEAAFRKVYENPAFVADLEAFGIDARFIDTATTQRFVREWHARMEPRFARLFE